MKLRRFGLSERKRFRSAIWGGDPPMISRYWERYGSIALLWVFTIPLSMIGLFTILFWVYGAGAVD